MKLSEYLGCLFAVTSSFTSLTNASSCTESNAIPFASDGGSDDYASSVNAEISAEGEANALGLIGKRAAVDLDCTSSETCLIYTDETLFCLDAITGDFHDSSGGAGNVITGEYTTSDGEIETTTDDEASSSSSTTSASASQSTISSESNMSCTKDVATPVSADTSSGEGGSGIDAIIQAGANCAAVDTVGTSSCSRKRASSALECISSELCILYGASVLLCLEAESGDFHDEYEGTGNAYSGEYTAANGEAQTITGTMLPTLPATGTTARATITSSRGNEMSTLTATNAAGNTNSGTSSAAQTSTAETQQGGAPARANAKYGVLISMALSIVAIIVIHV